MSTAGQAQFPQAPTMPVRPSTMATLAAQIPQALTVPPILVDDEAGAAAFGVGLRTFLELQHESWFPRPIVLGPRLKRHSLRELMSAVDHMPRQQARSEPAQLLRARIDKMKAGGKP